MATSDSRDIRIGTSAGARNSSMLPAPNDRYTGDAAANTAAYVPLGNEFDASSRQQALQGLSQGLNMWAKAQADVETVNDSIMARRMQADLMTASQKIITELSNSPDTMNKPGTWSNLYHERMGIAQEAINLKYDNAFYIGRNRLTTAASLRNLSSRETNKVALAAAERVSKMASDETNASIDIAIKSGLFDEAARINQDSPYLTDAQKMRNQFTIDQSFTTSKVQQKALSDPEGLLEEIQTKGSVDGRELSYELQQYGINQARSFINEAQKRNYDDYIQKFLLSPQKFNIDDAKKSLEVNSLNTSQFASLWRMWHQKTANVPPTPAEFSRASKYAASMIPQYQSSTPEQKANIINQFRSALAQSNFSALDQTSLINLMKTKTDPSYLDDAKTWVERVWDTGKYPLYVGKDVVDDNGTPISMTETEFRNSFMSKDKQYYLDKSETRAYDDPDTLTKRYIVREKVPNQANDSNFKNFLSQVRYEATQQIYNYMGEHGGQTPTETERYSILSNALSSVSKKSDIKLRGFFSYRDVFQFDESTINEQTNASRIIDLNRTFDLGDRTEIPSMPDGGYVITLGTPNSYIYEASPVSSKSNVVNVGANRASTIISKDLYKSSGGATRLMQIDPFYLQKPSEEAMEDAAERRARILKVNNGLSDEDEQSIYSALISYWNMGKRG